MVAGYAGLAVSMQNVGSELARDSEVNIASKLASYIGHLTASPLRVSQTHFAWIRLRQENSDLAGHRLKFRSNEPKDRIKRSPH